MMRTLPSCAASLFAISCSLPSRPEGCKADSDCRPREACVLERCVPGSMAPEDGGFSGVGRDASQPGLDAPSSEATPSPEPTDGGISDGSSNFDDSGSPDGSSGSADGGSGAPEACAPEFAGASSALAVSNRQITLAWPDATDCSTPASAIVYEICISTTVGLCAEHFTATKTTSPGATMWNIGGLPAETRQFFVVRARTADGRTDGNRVEVSAVTRGRRAIASGLGAHHACDLSPQGAVRCWGSNDFGQLGIGIAGGIRYLPAEVIGVADGEELGIGGARSCAVLTSGTVMCWGYNGGGLLAGFRGESVLASPVAISGLDHVVALSLGSAHACALMQDETLKCWGHGTEGELGNGKTESQRFPTAVKGLSNVVSVKASGGTTCAVLEDGSLKCWGANGRGQTGRGVVSSGEPSPIHVNGVDQVISVGTGATTCAVRIDGTVKCWGGLLGGDPGDFSDRTTPVSLPGIDNAVTVAMGDMHACLIARDQTLHCWGEGYLGEVGNGSNQWSVPSPTPVSGLTGVESAAAGYKFSCAVAAGGVEECWGDNSWGELGNGGIGSTQLSPVPLGCPPNYDICDGRCFSFATDSSHCGSCGNACVFGSCHAGTCQCPAGSEPCGTACLALSSDTANCGACGIQCLPGASCQTGECRCDAPRTICDGACVDVSANVQHCGSCGVVCSEDTLCVGGQCLPCPKGRTLCDSSCVDLTSDLQNCGECGRICPQGGVCEAGSCVCASPLKVCGGACVDTSNDSNNCGGCGTGCPLPHLGCMDGRCQCGPNMTLCPMGSCVDTEIDTDHCGSCFNSCLAFVYPNGIRKHCRGGACVCPDGMTDECRSSHDCLDLNNDPENCGKCWRLCLSPGTCRAGQCVCPDGFATCHFQCADFNVDPHNCGACDVECPVGTHCVSGHCQ